MNPDQMLNEVRELNLSFLMLAQAMIRHDKPQALYRLGISEEVADLLSVMSSQQLVRIASRSVLLCKMRFDDEMVWGLLTDAHAPDGTTATARALHASVLMAGRSVHAAA